MLSKKIVKLVSIPLRQYSIKRHTQILGFLKRLIYLTFHKIEYT